MITKSEIIKGMQHCSDWGNCAKCPFDDDANAKEKGSCLKKLHQAAIMLINYQADRIKQIEEEKETIRIDNEATYVGIDEETEWAIRWKCTCGKTLYCSMDKPRAIKYCWNCGRKIEWDNDN